MTPSFLSCRFFTRRMSCLSPATSTANSGRAEHYHYRRSSSSVQYLPWRQNERCKSRDDAFHHKFVGMMMLRQVLKNYAREEFNLIHFFDGVKLAVQNLCASVKSQDKEGHMASMLGPDLHNRFRAAFHEMKINKERIVLEVESIKNMKVAGIRTICGTAEPNDQYIINFLGQKIVTSKRDMFELEKRADSSGFSALFQYGKKLGISAAEKELKFQIDVKFFTKERFYIEQKREDGWLMIVGGLDLVSRAHKLRFESTLQDPNENYPLAWKIADIDFQDRRDNVDSDDDDVST